MEYLYPLTQNHAILNANVPVNNSPFADVCLANNREWADSHILRDNSLIGNNCRRMNFRHIKIFIKI
ncbi:hypothetical protein CBM2626_A190005 [Cupriavidus taiwanensis]|nr:hypothetical protein CBM2626_A190005 [Cupriavidus taiwanensis]